MKTLRLLAAVLACFAVSTVDAATWNKKTKVTFSGPFQIPAAASSNKVMTLGAGTYVFKLIESSSNRHIVQVSNEREDKIYSSILAIPDYRVNATSKTVMYFTERKAGAPVAVKSWFYPGDNFGQRFVYPKVQAVQVAAVVNQPVPAQTEEKKVVIETPEKQEIAYAPATFEKVDTADVAGEDGEAVKPEPAAEKQLPKSASPIYMFGAMGVLILAASFLSRRAASQLR